MTLNQLAAPLRRSTEPAEFVGKLKDIQNAAVDVVAPTSCLQWLGDPLHTSGLMESEVVLHSRVEPFLLPTGVTNRLACDWTDNALRQMCERLNIPPSYLLRLHEHADGRARRLAANSVNTMAAVYDKPTLFRLWADPNVNRYQIRAVLSDRYQAIDNWDVLRHVTEGMQEADIALSDCEVSVDWTDKRFRMRVAVPSIAVAAPDLLEDYRSPFLKKDEAAPIIWAGIEVTNSETGHGAFAVAARAVVLKCRNGLTEGANFRRAHVGATLESGTIDWSNETRQNLLQLVQSQIKDAVRTYVSPEYLNGLVNRMRMAKGVEVENVQNAIATLVSRQGVTEAEADSVLEMFVRGGDRTVFGLGQALTAAASTVDSGDRQSEMEGMMWDVVGQPYRYAGTAPTPA